MSNIISERELAKRLNKTRVTMERWRLIGKIKPSITVKGKHNRYYYDWFDFKTVENSGE